MFSEKEKAEYKSITAPDELKGKLMMAEQSRRYVPYHRLYIAAACIAVIMSLSVMWDWQRSDVFLQENGNTMTFALVTSLAPNDSRELTKPSVPLVFSTSHKRKIAVSEGSLIYQDAKSGEVLESGSEILIEGDTELLWELDGQTEKSYELQVTGWGKDKTYLLAYDQETETWKIQEQ